MSIHLLARVQAGHLSGLGTSYLPAQDHGAGFGTEEGDDVLAGLELLGEGEEVEEGGYVDYIHLGFPGF